MCDEEEEQQGNEDCDLKPEDEEPEGMPGYPGGCPNDEECGGASEEEEELLLAALDRQDIGAVVAMVRGSEFINVNGKREAIQLLSCGRSVVAHIPIQRSTLAELSAALLVGPQPTS